MRHVRMLIVLSVLAIPAVALCFEASKGLDVMGRITAIQPDKKSLTVLTTSGQELKLRVDDKTKLEFDGRSVALASFAVGDPVKVRYEPGSEWNRSLILTSDATTARDVRQKVLDGLKTAGKYAHREKEQFKKRMSHVLQDLDAQIAKLEARAKDVKEDARQRYAEEIASLKTRAKVVRKELSKASSATAESWEEVKKGTSKTLEGLSNAIDRAAAWLRK